MFAYHHSKLLFYQLINSLAQGDWTKETKGILAQMAILLRSPRFWGDDWDGNDDWMIRMGVVHDEMWFGLGSWKVMAKDYGLDCDQEMGIIIVLTKNMVGIEWVDGDVDGLDWIGIGLDRNWIGIGIVMVLTKNMVGNRWVDGDVDGLDWIG